MTTSEVVVNNLPEGMSQGPKSFFRCIERVYLIFFGITSVEGPGELR